MAVLVTGGASFIGSHTVKRLLAGGREIVVYDPMATRGTIQEILSSSELAQIRLVAGDILDTFDLLRTMRQNRVDEVVHLAAALGPVCESNPPLGLRINGVGFVNVLEAARLFGIRRVVWASSAAVYGPADRYPHARLTEDDPHHPLNVYGATKVLNEHLARHYFDHFGVDNIGLRFTTVYGPGRVAGLMAHKLSLEMMQKPAMGLPGRVPCGDDTIDFQYVDDAARAIELALNRAGATRTRVFNIVGDLRPVRDGVDYVRRLIPGADVTTEPGVWGVAQNYAFDRARDELGYEPAYRLEEGIRLTVNYYRRRHGLPEV